MGRNLDDGWGERGMVDAMAVEKNGGGVVTE